MNNPFAAFQTDTIRIISKDGSKKSRDLKAHVTSKQISLYELDVDVTEGDFIERDLPNNKTEVYEILEANFHKEFQVIPAHYIFKVKKTTAINRFNQTNTHNVFNVTGNNSRIYQHSNDSSGNLILESNDEVFLQLKEIILTQIDGNEKLLALVDDMQNSAGKPSFLDKYNAFIGSAANHMTIIAPLIPALTKFLSAIN